MKLKSLLAGAAAVVFAAGVAGAANLSLLSGSQYSEPSQILATVNTLIQNINFGVSGRLNANVTTTSATLATTAEQTLATYTLPANRLAVTGDGVRVVCWGTTAANTDAKTIKLYFGTSAMSSVSMGGQPNNKKWRLEMTVLRSGSATQTVVGNAQFDITSAGNVVFTNSGTDDLTANQVIKCTGLNPTTGQDITATGMLVEQIK